MHIRLSAQFLFFVQVLSCVTSILQTDQEVKVRQAALLVLKLTIRSLSQDAIEVRS